MQYAESDAAQKRSFSERYHKAGRGKTNISLTTNPLIRMPWNYCSYKREGVDRLAALTTHAQYTLDVGAGNGAYSYWYLGRKKLSPCIAVDWSFAALRKVGKPGHKNLLPVCADVHYLPFKSGTFDALFSVDTFGHVAQIEKVLDEILRVAKCGSSLFFHSECSDYQCRWPDTWLIRKNGKDVLAELDGHFSLRTSAALYSLYHQRFYVRSFFSPAGILGWLFGYPEKYRIGFKQARLHFFTILTTIMAVIKMIPFLGHLLRCFNALTNRIELFLGLYGGGSCFAYLEKPVSDNNEKQYHG